MIYATAFGEKNSFLSPRPQRIHNVRINISHWNGMKRLMCRTKFTAQRGDTVKDTEGQKETKGAGEEGPLEWPQ